MKEIKSFREYIAEQELLKEVDEGDDINAIYNDDNDKEISANEKSAAEIPDNKNQPKQNTNEDDDNSSSDEYLTVYKNFEIKYSNSSKSSQEKVDELENMLMVLERTFNRALKRDLYLTAEDFKPKDFDVKLNQKNSGAYLNLTNSNSLKIIKNNWESENLNLLKQAKEAHKAKQNIDVLKQKGLFLYKGKKVTFDELKKAAERGEVVPEAIKRLIEKEKQKNSQNQTKPQNDEIQEEFIEEGIGRKIRDLFKTTGEISSGIGNRFSPRNIISTADKGPQAYRKDEHGERIGIYRIDSNYLEKIYTRFLSSGESIIGKEIKDGQVYLNRAKANIEKYRNLRYVGDDNRYLSEISRDLFRALSVATSIGYSLRTLLKSYQNTLNKISEEFGLRKVKDEKALESLDAGTAIEKIQQKISKKEVVGPHNRADYITGNGKTLADADAEKNAENAENEAKKQMSEQATKIMNLARDYFVNTINGKNFTGTPSDFLGDEEDEGLIKKAKKEGSKKKEEDESLIEKAKNAKLARNLKKVFKLSEEMSEKDIKQAIAIATRLLYNVVKSKEIEDLDRSDLKKSASDLFDEKYESFKNSKAKTLTPEKLLDSIQSSIIKDKFGVGNEEDLEDYKSKLNSLLRKKFLDQEELKKAEDLIKKISDVEDTFEKAERDEEASELKKYLKQKKNALNRYLRYSGQRKTAINGLIDKGKSKFEQAHDEVYEKRQKGKLKKVTSATSAAKDFEGETPEEPTKNMTILQYATYKAQKNNNK